MLRWVLVDLGGGGGGRVLVRRGSWAYCNLHTRWCVRGGGAGTVAAGTVETWSEGPDIADTVSVALGALRLAHVEVGTTQMGGGGTSTRAQRVLSIVQLAHPVVH